MRECKPDDVDKPKGYRPSDLSRKNKDLIAATGLAMLLKLDSNCWFFGPCEIEIRWMTSSLYVTSSFVHDYKAITEFKLGLQSGNAQFGSKSAIFLSCVTLKFDGWSWAPLLCYFKRCASFRSHWWYKLELQSGDTQLGSKSAIFCLVWPWNLTDDLEKQ